MTKQGSLQEVRGRSRVVPGPESDPEGLASAKKGSSGPTKVTSGRDFWVVSERKGSKKRHFLWP